MSETPVPEQAEPPPPPPPSEPAGETPPPQFVGYRAEVLQRLEDWPFGDSPE